MVLSVQIREDLSSDRIQDLEYLELGVIIAPEKITRGRKGRTDVTPDP